MALLEDFATPGSYNQHMTMKVTSPQVYIRVAVEGAPAHLDAGVLTYLPKKGQDVPVVGQLIRVPLRAKLVLGFVVELIEEKPEFSLRPIGDPIEPEVILTPEQYQLSAWLTRETAGSFFSCAALFLPPGRLWKAVDVFTLNSDTDLNGLSLTKTQQMVINELQVDEELTLDALRTRTGKKLGGVLPDLIRKGVIHRWQRPENRVPRTRQREVLDAIVDLEKWRRSEGDELIPLVDVLEQVDASTSTLDSLESKGAIEVVEVASREAPQPRSSTVPSLTGAQSTVWGDIERALQAGDSKPNLLYYFASKDDVHRMLLERLLDTWLEPLRHLDPDGDPEMKQSATQPNQAEGDDDPAETGST